MYIYNIILYIYTYIYPSFPIAPEMKTIDLTLPQFGSQSHQRREKHIYPTPFWFQSPPRGEQQIYPTPFWFSIVPKRETIDLSYHMLVTNRPIEENNRFTLPNFGSQSRQRRKIIDLPCSILVVAGEPNWPMAPHRYPPEKE